MSIMLIAGHETTALTLAFALFELAQLPLYEKLLLEEVDKFGRNEEIGNDDSDKVDIVNMLYIYIL